VVKREHSPPAASLHMRMTGLRLVVVTAIVAGAYFICAEFGFRLAFAVKQVTAVWPPTGIALAALLLLGFRVWPGIWLGAFISNAFSGEPIVTAAGIAAGNTLGPVLGAFALHRFAGFDNALERVRDVLSLVVFGSALAMIVTATNGVANLAASGIVPWGSYGSVWWVWWAGDAMGVLVVAPLLLTWLTPRRHARRATPRAAEIVIVGTALLTTAWFSFMSSLPLAFPVYPFVIWTALRGGQRETSLAVAVIAAIAIWGTAHNLGPFASGSFDHRLVLLMAFMAVLAVTGLVLGAIVAERRSAGVDLRQARAALRGREEQLQAAERRFQVLAETVPQTVWTADATGWIDWYNHRWYEFTGQSSDEAAGWGWQRAYHADDLSRVMQTWAESIVTGEPFEMEVRIRRSDGAFRWFLVRAESLRDARGNVVRWYGTNTDIDGQMRTLEQTTRAVQTLQSAFLPERLPSRPNARFDALYLTAGQEALVGGDWYDAFELADGRIVVSIGDVAGHGLGAAVTASHIRHGIFASALDDADPAVILDKVNRMLRFQEETVATALVAVVDPDRQTMNYATAGHPPPIIAGPTIPARSLPYGGVPLGVTTTVKAHGESVVLESDAVVVFYTDGVTEFKRDIEAAEQALRAAVARLVTDHGTPQPAIAIRRSVMGCETPRDDAVLMVLQLSATEARATPADAARYQKTWSFHSSDAFAAHATRHEVMRFVRGFADTNEDLFPTELVIGEILANTVEHAPGLVRLEVDWTTLHPIVTVVDTGPGLSRLQQNLPDDGLTEHGRGLFLIATYARHVRLEDAQGSGTRMRVVLPVSKHRPDLASKA
jgi:PAS domain S-box-containing protein